MCYDISFTTQINELSQYFPDLIFAHQIAMDFEPAHIAGHAYGEHPIIYNHKKTNATHCRLMEWGCIPFYVKEEAAYKKQRATMLNARSEKILNDRNSFWYKIKSKRCLIPVTGFFEHRHVKSFKNKIPYLLQLKEQPVFFLPGLYDSVLLPNVETGELIERFTFSIITRAANAIMQLVHNGGANAGRMPLMLPLALSKQWIDISSTDAELNNILQFEMDSEGMDYKTVFSLRTANERTDGLGKDAAYVWENLPDLGFV